MALAVSALLLYLSVSLFAAPLQNDSPAIDPALRADIQRLLDDAGIKQLMTIQIDQMTKPMTAMLSSNKNLPPGFVEEWLKRFKGKFLNGQVEEIAIQEYAKYYTRAEIQQMIAYQESPVGRKARQVTPQMMTELGGKMAEMGQRMGLETAKELMQEHPEYMNKADQGSAAGPASGGVMGTVPDAPPPPQGSAHAQRVDQETQSAKLIKKVEAVYPPLAKSARVQGTIRFTALIDKNGNVESLTLISGHRLAGQLE